MPDEIFSNPRLAQIYDIVDSDRSDLDHYVDIVREFTAGSVLDVGCGTGTLACLLAATGIEVVGVDPAEASLDVARSKTGGEHVTWVLGDATTLPPLAADLAVMTGNVAQVVLEDTEWNATLTGIGSALAEAGRFVFEVRDPARRAWEEWTRENTHQQVDLPGGGTVETWIDLLDVAPPLVTFQSTYRFDGDAEPVVSQSTLRFRERDEVEESLITAGFRVEEVRDAPDRPGKEFVFIAARA